MEALRIRHRIKKPSRQFLVWRAEGVTRMPKEVALASRLLGGGRRRRGRSRLVMMVVVMMAVMMVVMMMVVMVLDGSRSGGRRSGFLRHGVAGEAQREDGGG
jgi:hypothetical protein